MQYLIPARGGVLLEQWIEGIEYSVDSYVLNGKCTTMSIGQYHPFSLPDVFVSYETVWPANLPEDTKKLIETTNRKIVEGFGLVTGRTHAEYMVSNGICYLVEIGARGGGSYFSSDDVRYVTGISTEDFLLDFALGEDVAPVIHREDICGCCCTLFFYLPEFGVVQSIDGLDQVANYSYVKRNNLYQIHIGKETCAVVNKGARMFLVVKADSYEQLEERVNDIRTTLQIKTVCKDGIVRLPIWR